MLRVRTLPSVLALACFCVSLAPTTGCHRGPKLPPTAVVTGQVTLDGKPLPCGTVTFVADRKRGNSGPTGFSEIDKNGHYRISTAGVDGAMVGWHKIRVLATDGSKPGNPWIIPIEYDHPTKSGLEAEVKPDIENVINLPLRSDYGKPEGNPS